MQRSRIFTYLIAAVGSFVVLGGSAFAQVNLSAVDVFKADRGFRPTGSYSLSDIESVNDTNGNVSLSIPLAQTPPGRNGHSFKLSLLYNSGLYDLAPQSVDVNWMAGVASTAPSPLPAALSASVLEPRDLNAHGGWKYSYRNYLEHESRPCGSETTTYCSLWRLVLADGGSHLLRMRVPNDAFNDPLGTGFTQMEHWGYRNAVTGDNQYYGPNRVFYTTDGSFIRVEMDATIQSSGPFAVTGSWSAYFPDGRVLRGLVQNWPKDADQLCDRNGQCTLISGTYDATAGLPVTELADPMGRRISIAFNSTTGEDEIKVLGYGASVSTLNPRENPASLTTKVKWKYIYGGQTKPASFSTPWNGIFYSCRPQDWDGNESNQHTCVTYYAFSVVEKITLPTGAPNLFYGFQYADSLQDAANRSRGELREMTFPKTGSPESAARVNYTWKLKEINAHGSGWNPLNWFDAIENPLESKTVTYHEQDGGAPAAKTQTWTYSFARSASEITAPSLQKSKFYFTDKGELGNWKKGLVHKTVSIPEGGSEAAAATTWKCWAPNEPWLGVNAVDDPRNAFTRVEYRKLGEGSSLMSAVLTDQDKNGNVVLKQEFDWMTAPGGNDAPPCSPTGTILRQTANRYWNPAGGASSPAYAALTPTKGMTSAYWAESAAPTRNSLLETRIFAASSAAPAAVTQNSYDDPNGRANLRFQYRWDDTKGAAPAVATTGVTLSSANAVISERQYVDYGSYSLPSYTVDESGNVTAVTYGALTDSGCSAFSNLYPTSTAAPEGQTKTFKYDCATGHLKEEIQTSNNNLKTTYDYDIFGRLTEKIDAANETNTAKKLRTTTTYDDVAGIVRVVTDRDAFNDQQLAVVYHFNQLGELYMERGTDDTGGAISASGTAGVKGIQVSRVETGRSISVASNPYRSTSDGTMGWTRKEFDSEGRIKEEAHYRGASIPWAGGSANLTGKTSYSYSGDATTTSDAAGATTTVTTDALGRVKTVAQSGMSGASYTYDLLDNLKTVSQTDPTNHPGESVNRSFVYTSLGRLLSATNPESGLTSYEYYNNGTTKKRTDARGASVTFTVDGLNRVTQKLLVGGTSSPQTAYFCYDGKEFAFASGAGSCVSATRTDYVRGVLTAHGMVRNTTLVGWTVFNNIDALGRTWASSQKIEGLTATSTFQYEFNAGGSLTKLQYPSGRSVTYAQTGTNRTSLARKGTSGSDYYMKDMTYSPAGAPTGAVVGEIAGGTSFTQSWTYNSRLQPRQMSVGSQGSLLSLRWEYGANVDGSTFEETSSDNNGNVRAEKIQYGPSGSPIAIRRTFVYDQLNRITSFIEDTGKSQGFGYDGFGNLWQDGAATGVPAIAQTGPTWYRDAAAPAGSKIKNRLNGVSYDAAGNQEDLSPSGGTIKVRYDAEGRQVKVEDTASPAEPVLAEYWYDAEGRRVRRTAGGVTTYYVYDAMGQLMAEYGGTGSGSGTQYLVTDTLGSTRLIVGASANCIRRSDYAPFGTEIPRDSQQWSCYGGSTSNTLKFTGKERDAETGLDYFDARYMSVAQGRFMSADPLDGWADDPQSWNRYAYARNNPLLYSDPSGMQYTICDMSGNCHDDYSDADFDKNLSGTSKNGVIYDNDGNEIGTYQRTSFDDLSPMGNLFFAEMSNRRSASNKMIGTVAVGSAAVGAVFGTGAVVAVIDGVAYTWESLVALGPEALAKLVAAGKIGQELWGRLQAAIGPIANWVRIGSSYSQNLQQKISLSIRWGASPAKGGKYVNQIGSPILRDFNQWIRGQRIPLPGWRAADPGHFHLRK